MEVGSGIESSLGLLLHLNVVLLVLDVSVMMWNFKAAKGTQYGKFPWLYSLTKVFLVPLITSIWWQIAPVRSIYVKLYCLFTWIGDLLLLVPGFPFLAAGSCGFVAGHMLLPFYYKLDWSRVPNVAYLMMIPPFLFHFCLLVPRLDFTKISNRFAVIYIIMLEYGAFCAIARLSQYPILHPSYLMCSIGYLFFVLSDFFLMRNEFNTDKVPRRIEILLSYAIAQTLIILGTVFA